ncbi:MAG: hypothetical protein NVSMB13_12070 [Mycobacteriales bacterium]
MNAPSPTAPGAGDGAEPNLHDEVSPPLAPTPSVEPAERPLGGDAVVFSAPQMSAVRDSLPHGMPFPTVARTPRKATSAASGPPSGSESPRTGSTVADRRDQAGERRDRAADRRDEAGERRDHAARQRDHIARQRDHRAQQRDLAAESAEAQADPGYSQAALDRSARARREAGSDRKEASEDRRVGASERSSAHSDRDVALADRGTALADRGASAQERADASADGLTGVYLRGAGLIEVERELARARRTSQPLVLAFLDVDHLKAVNDSEGHAAGDQLLVAVASTLRSVLRPYDVVVRFGGDEFVCALPGLRRADATKRFAQVHAALATGEHQGEVTVGLAELRPEDSLDDLIARADAALYELRRLPQRR